MPKFVRKPVVIEAFRLGEEWPDWWADAVSANQVRTHNIMGEHSGGPDFAMLMSKDGVTRAEKGDWIIRGVKGEIYSCKPDVFEMTYEPAPE